MPDEIKLPSVDAVDPNLNTDLTITPDEARAEFGKVILTLAASDPNALQGMLESIERAKRAKMSADNILGLFTSIAGKALDIVL